MIRKANKTDIIDIENLGKGMYNNFHSLYNIDSYMDNESYIILVHEKNDVNAFLLAYKNFEILELEFIIVSDTNRHEGIGSELINYLVDNFAKNVNKILLEVSEQNVNAIKFYKKMGFEITNVRKKYYQNDDAYIMEKVI